MPFKKNQLVMCVVHISTYVQNELANQILEKNGCFEKHFGEKILIKSITL